MQKLTEVKRSPLSVRICYIKRAWRATIFCRNNTSCILFFLAETNETTPLASLFFGQKLTRLKIFRFNLCP